MQDERSTESFDFEHLLFWFRWPYWVLLVVVALLTEGARLELDTLIALLAIAAVLNLLFFLLIHLLRNRAGLLAAIFSTFDLLLVAALIFLAGQWPTPFYPLLFFPIVTIGLRFGGLWGLIGGLSLALVGLSTLAFSIAGEIGDLSRVERVIALISLPFVGGFSGWISRAASRQRLRVLTREVENLRLARERSDAVYAMASTLGAGLSHQKILEALFDVSAIEFRAIGLDPRGMIGVALLFEERPHEPRLYVAAGHNVKEEDWNVRCPATGGALLRALKSSEPVVLETVNSDPELKQFVSLAKARSAILVPLRAGFDAYGIILFASPQPGAYHPDRCYFLTAFANQVTIALQNARLFKSLQDERNRIIDQQEEIRRQIARELHDGPTQTIASLAMRLNYARVLLNHDLNKAEKELAELEDLARRTTKEIRTMLFTLRPVVLETQGLGAALRQYGERLQETDGLALIVDDARFRATLSDEVAGVVFSILEEAINNARKHAQAHRVTVRLESTDEVLFAEVQDDGIGFDLQLIEQSYDQRGSLGLINMRERAVLIGGNLTIRSQPGQGTTVTLVVPLRQPATDKTVNRPHD